MIALSSRRRSPTGRATLAHLIGAEMRTATLMLIRDKDEAILVVIAALLLLSLIAACAALTIAKGWPAGKLLSTASGLAGLASFYQLKSSGWFEKVLSLYSDENQHPYGPPSAIVRKIIDDPDHPTWAAVRNAVFFDPSTGAKLAVAALILSVASNWA